MLHLYGFSPAKKDRLHLLHLIRSDVQSYPCESSCGPLAACCRWIPSRRPGTRTVSRLQANERRNGWGLALLLAHIEKPFSLSLLWERSGPFSLSSSLSHGLSRPRTTEFSARSWKNDWKVGWESSWGKWRKALSFGGLFRRPTFSPLSKRGFLIFIEEREREFGSGVDRGFSILICTPEGVIYFFPSINVRFFHNSLCLSRISIKVHRRGSS